MNPEEVVAAHHEISGHGIAQFHLEKRLGQFRRDPGLESAGRVPGPRGSAPRVATGNHELRAGIQRGNHLGQDCRIVLQIGIDHADIITGGRQECFNYGRAKAAVFVRRSMRTCGFRAPISCGSSAIRRIVVCDQQFGINSRQCDVHFLNETRHIRGFIVCGGHDSYLHGVRSISIKRGWPTRATGVELDRQLYMQNRWKRSRHLYAMQVP